MSVTLLPSTTSVLSASFRRAEAGKTSSVPPIACKQTASVANHRSFSKWNIAELLVCFIIDRGRKI